MTEFCTVHVTDSWEPDTDPNIVTEYDFTDAANTSSSEIVVGSPSARCRDHLSRSLSSLPDRLLVTHRPQEGVEDSPNCTITLQCKPHHNVDITGVSVASEARLLELYDARNGSYLHTMRGTKDKDDSEADNSRIHFLCKQHLDQPVRGLTIKFLSLGQRVSFEIAHIRVHLQASLMDSGGRGGGGGGQTIDMERLKQQVDAMGDSVSDRAKAFLTTLENFQKSKHGGVDEMRQLLTEKNCPKDMGQSMGGITALMSMFMTTQNQGQNSRQPANSFPTEGAMMNHMLNQMMGQMSVAGGGGGGEDGGGMYKFLQSVCGQVSQQRKGDAEQSEGAEATMAVDQASSAKGVGEAEEARLEQRVKSQVEAAVASQLTAVEEHIKQEVDHKMEQLEARMSTKLDAIFTLLQQQQQQQKPS